MHTLEINSERHSLNFFNKYYLPHMCNGPTKLCYKHIYALLPIEFTK